MQNMQIAQSSYVRWEKKQQQIKSIHLCPKVKSKLVWEQTGAWVSPLQLQCEIFRNNYSSGSV